MRELLGGFQDRALERLVKLAFGGMSNLRETVSATYRTSALLDKPDKESASRVPETKQVYRFETLHA